MRETFNHDYPPNEWTVEDVERALRSTEETYQLPTYDDAAVWTTLQDDALTGPAVESLLADAREQRGEPVPPVPASKYLQFERTGERHAYQAPQGGRRSRLSLFALAECFEREGTYLDDILDYAWAICEQSTWVLPAHLEADSDHNHEGLPGVVDDDRRVVALYSTLIAELLAEVDYLLSDQLHPALHERIQAEVDRRIITPYLASEDHWWLSPPAMNWNAVCNSSVMTAALHVLEDPRRQARVLTRGAHSLEHYLADFDADGCTAEGIGYWSYGFGHYVHIAAALEARTDGELSLCSPPIVADIAEYPLKVELSPNRYAPFSDTAEEAWISPGVVSWLGTRFGIEGLGALGRQLLRERGLHDDFDASMAVLRDLLWTRDVPADWQRTLPSRRQFFDGHNWWFARNDPADSDALVVGAKGGNNGEPHNHNDCGSFVVHYRGESLLTDLGRPTYDRDYFDDDYRYNYLAARSLGHSVPLIGDCEQAAGTKYAAEVRDRAAGDDRESVTLDLVNCYPDSAGLASLARTVTLERGTPGCVTISDRATFAADATGTFESVLVSYFPMDATDAELVVDGERSRATVTPSFADADAIVTVERLPDAIDGRDVWRARIIPDADGVEDGIDLTLAVAVTPK